jgi:hypothetical protein
MEDSRIFVHFRKGHGITEDVKECLDYIKVAGIVGSRLGGIHEGYAIVRDIAYEDRDRVLKILKRKGLPIVAEWLEPRPQKH